VVRGPDAGADSEIARSSNEATSVSAAVAGEPARGIGVMAEGAQATARTVSQSVADMDEVTERTNVPHCMIMES
jgi:hypothetical protein